MALRVLHLAGSAVSGLLDELSRLYARDCLDTIADPDRYEPLLAHVSPDGSWRFPAGFSDAELAAAAPYDTAHAVARIAALAPQVAVPQMFCLPGMTRYRALLELLDIPYIGNRPGAMALTARKDRARAVVAGAGVRVPVGETVRPGEPVTIGAPAVVKPVDADNSVGVTLVGDAAEFPDAVACACAHAPAALVERFIPAGREVRCAVLVRDGELVPLALEEYPIAADRPIRGVEDKLGRDRDGSLRLMAKGAGRAWIVDEADPVTSVVWAAAKRCHVALGCRHYSLFDFRIDPAGRPWFLEAGLYCSFARQSVITTMAQASGIDPRELFATAVGQALREPALAAVGSAS